MSSGISLLNECPRDTVPHWSRFRESSDLSDWRQSYIDPTFLLGIDKGGQSIYLIFQITINHVTPTFTHTLHPAQIRNIYDVDTNDSHATVTDDGILSLESHSSI